MPGSQIAIRDLFGGSLMASSANQAFITAFTELVGVEHPIALAPMGGVVESGLAAAVGYAGGYRIMPFSWSQLDDIELELQALRAKTDRPFAGNLCLDMPQEARLELCLSTARTVHFFWGDAAPYVARVHAKGALVIQTGSDSEEAKRAVDAGVDLLGRAGLGGWRHVRGNPAAGPEQRWVPPRRTSTRSGARNAGSPERTHLHCAFRRLQGKKQGLSPHFRRHLARQSVDFL